MRSKSLWLAGGVAIAVAAAFIVAIVANRDGSSGSAPPASLSPTADVLQALAAVPFAAIAGADASSVVAPQAIAATPITVAGKPEVLYVGAEFCPFCAAERWPLYLALSHFGEFSGVTVTRSSSTDIHPNTPTLNFHGATYSSDVLAFTPVELESNVPDGNGGYEPLDTLTAAQQQTVTEVSPQGGIPIIDLGGKYLISGAAYDPGGLSGMSALGVADSLATTNANPGSSILAAAKSITTSLCDLTSQQPTNVCQSGN